MADDWRTLKAAVQDSLTRAKVPAHQKVWVAVSGGADSMALLLATHAVHAHVGAIHVDHGLRETSQRDREFVEAEAHRLGLNCRTHIAQGLAERSANRGEGLEAAARAERYTWFSEVAGDQGIVLLGHHAGDQKETQLLHWLRGSRPETWSGMAKWTTERGYAVGRPFLSFPKSALVQALKAQNITWLEDPSNEDPIHLRNRVRHELLPLLEDLRPGWSDGMHRAAAMAKEWETHTRSLLVDLPSDALPLSVLNQAPSKLQMIALWAKPYGFRTAQLDALMALALPDAEVGSRADSIHHSIWRERDALVARSGHAGPSPTWSFSPHPKHAPTGSLHTPTGTLSWSFVPASASEIDPNDGSAQLSFDTLSPPLTLRPWKDGDQMAPIGMTGHQSVSNILTQRKVDHLARQSTLVVTSQSHIVWLIGHRIHRDHGMAMPSSKLTATAPQWTLLLNWEPE